MADKLNAFSDRTISIFKKLPVNAQRGIVWFFINTLISLVVFILISLNSLNSTSSHLWIIFWSSMIIAHTVGFSCVIVGYSIGDYYIKTGKSSFQIYIIAGLLTAFFANFISQVIIHFLFHYPGEFMLGNNFWIRTIAVVLIATTAASILVLISSLKYKKQIFEAKLKSFENDTLSIKCDESIQVISLNDLIYLSSHGKRTVLHTNECDYEANHLLKDVEGKLPESFMRIHKQFIINTKYISRIKYNEGGRYLAFLKDEDESTLPVGRTIAPFLKERLGV